MGAKELALEDIDACLGIREREPAEALATLIEWKVERLGVYDGLDDADRRDYGRVVDAFRRDDLEAGLRLLLIKQYGRAVEICFRALDEYLVSPGLLKAKEKFVDALCIGEFNGLRDDYRRHVARRSWPVAADQIDRMWVEALLTHHDGEPLASMVVLRELEWMPSDRVKPEVEQLMAQPSTLTAEESAVWTRIVLEITQPRATSAAPGIGL